MPPTLREDQSRNLMVFSKHLAGPSFEEIARRLRAIGIQQIDLTVRPEGHVEPSQVEDALPKAAEQLASQGVRIGMISTGITDAHDPTSQSVLRTAAKLGISHYKIGYFIYKGFGTLRKARDEARAHIRDLTQLNAELGIVGGYHNHSDTFLGANLGDIDFLLDGTDPKHIGLYFDPCHAVIEGGSGGWVMGLDLLAERVVMLAVKDFLWAEAGKRYAGARAYSIEFCPLQDGNVPWPRVLTYLQTIGFNGPISFHSEYQGPHAFQDLTTDEVFEQTARDLDLWRQWNAPTP